MIVPDSITPIEGWKSFNLVDGVLHSPSYAMGWPVGEKAEANCQNLAFTYSWVVATGKEPEVAGEENKFLPPTFFTANSYFSMNPPPKPKTILPEGKYWSLEMIPLVHDAPDSNCSCGIYVADNVEAVAGYGNILGKVHGWGTVVKHSGGHRVQYAYPSELYAHSVEQALELAAYGVPVLLKEDVTDKNVRSMLAALASGFFNEETIPSSGPGRGVTVAIPIMLSGLAITEGVIQTISPSIPGSFLFAWTAAVAGFSIALSLGHRWWVRNG